LQNYLVGGMMKYRFATLALAAAGIAV